MRTMNTKLGHAAWMALALTLTSACGEEAAETPPEPTEAPEVAEPVVEAPPPEVTPEAVLAPPTAEALADATATGAIAREIDAEPARAEAILAAHELEVDAFEARLFAVAAHPALTQAYTAARTATE